MVDEEYMCSLFVRCNFTKDKAARDLLLWFSRCPELFRPTRYDMCEPVRKVFQPDDLSDPVSLLIGDDHSGGGLLLKGSRYGFIATICWSQSQHLSQWSVFGNNDLFNSKERTDRFVDFLVELCKKFTVEYGVAGTWEDWKAKHWECTPSSQTSYGLEMDKGLCSIQWITILGPRLVAEFGGISRIETLPIFRVVRLANGGTLLRLRESPLLPKKQAARLSHDNQIMSMLGREYFFDIMKINRIHRSISGLTDVVSDE